MSTVPLTIRVDPVLYQKAAAKARSENCALEQAIVTMLDKWVESEIIYIDEYVVQSGDTLARIALKLYGDAKRYTVLAEFNGITDPRLLRVGQILRVPPLPGIIPTPTPTPPPEVAPTEPTELNIEFIQSPHYNERPTGSKIWVVVIHASENSSLEGLVTWFTNPQTKVSAHYNIGKDGRIVQMVRDGQRGWHAGWSVWKGIRNVNDFSIGIELVNKGNGVDPYPEVQYRTLVALCKRLVAQYAIRTEDIVGHKDVSLAGKTDPKGLDLEQLRKDVAA